MNSQCIFRNSKLYYRESLADDVHEAFLYSKVIVSSSQCLHQSDPSTVVFSELIHRAKVADTATLENRLSLSSSKHLLIGNYLPLFRCCSKRIIWKGQGREMVLQKRVKENIRVSMGNVEIVLCVRDKNGSSDVL